MQKSESSPPRPSEELAPGVSCLRLSYSNLYLVRAGGGSWVLVDTGTPGAAGYIQLVAEERYGAGARPTAIILTHGHADHVGSALDLADRWKVPIYAHPHELPYLTGQASYPPPDPTIGGAVGLFARFFPRKRFNLRGRIKALPESGEVPGLPGWRWLHTPGHTPGHVSLFREEDGTLLAGDAVATTDLDSWTAQLAGRAALSRPPAPFTPDWVAARESVERLAKLEPQVVGAGHGPPVTGPQTAANLKKLATQDFTPPTGRYARRPARYDEDGVLQDVPPPAADPLPGQLLSSAFFVGTSAALFSLWRRTWR